MDSEEPPEPITEADLLFLEPESAQEREKRALFLAASASMLAMQLIHELNRHCNTLTFNDRRTEGETGHFNQTLHRNALKELSALIIWLILVEHHTDEPPIWTDYFFSECWAGIDTIYEDGETSQAILQTYQHGLDVGSTCDEVAMRICHQLGVSSSAPVSTLFFSALLKDSAELRATMFANAIRCTLAEQEQIATKQAADF